MVEIVNAEQLLKNSTEDQAMNQKVVFLTGDDDNAFFMIELHPNRTLPAHYHKEKIEIYYILKGVGTVITAKFKNGKVMNPCTQNVGKGDVFSITPYTVHQITNTGTEVLQILALAPKSHSAEDRYFVTLTTQ
ncbi:cupin domain-containing protein [Chryseobacterium sp. BIGb0232]|uniref:cupin domain-containing protein n=1 Tax=Chryseobacterium sp. BIGb0232 TaxID=2940598 RepID=UPI000FB4A407|nr:cupin domain-containing protein [Chryseobacterium sp. BIGb0232]MCS4300765.1 mannose-6-phosphate isomerase-like protein (cupin superfamily) [Chryseobacterium sp. BIGb0232]ROS20355.1 cupin domain [Chryseobacterium nakagawai]